MPFRLERGFADGRFVPASDWGALHDFSPALHRDAARASVRRARLGRKPAGMAVVSTAGRRSCAVFRIALAACVAMLVAGCASTPPKRQADLCAVFEQHPAWYDYARDSADKWGTPMHVLMAFVRHESSYRSDARPPFRWFLFIPLGRASSAKGYAQAQDPVWGEYQEERGQLFRSRSDMEDALDFVGWYNYKTVRQTGQRDRGLVSVAARALRRAVSLRFLVPGLAVLRLTIEAAPVPGVSPRRSGGMDPGGCGC